MTSYNLADLFESVVDAVPERLALVAGAVRLSYRQLDERINRLAHHLLAQGVNPGDKVGIYAFNRAEWVEAMWACFKIRALPVNINYRYVADELFYLFDNADLVAVIHEQAFSPVLATLRDRLPLLRHYVAIDDGSDDSRGAMPLPGSVRYEEALAAQSAARPSVQRSGDDLYMLYTGGTTGLPKGTLWRHEDIFFAALQGGNPGGAPISAPEQLAELARANANPFPCLCPAPMMHGGGAWYCMIYQLSANTFVLYTERAFDADKLLELAARERAVSLIVVGDAMARPVADAIASGRHDTSSLFVIGSGGAILSKVVKDQLKQLLPNGLILDSFGATETGAGGSVFSEGGSAPRFTLTPNTAILDEHLRPLTPGSETAGRIARCGHIPLGYYKDEVKTASTIQTDKHGKRWVIPGDYALLLADGTAELLGRGSGCINSGGEKIYPEEVESALKAHPFIYDAGVVGVADARYGARVVAVVVPREGQRVDSDEVNMFCRGKLAAYKCPRQLIVVDELPRTPVGKPDYRRIKAIAEGA